MSPSPSPEFPSPKPAKVKARSIVYIDGFNFYYGVIQGTGHKWLDLETYFLRLRQDDLIQRIHYFTSPVMGLREGTNQQAYLDALDTCPSVDVTLGNHKRKTLKCQVRACSFGGDRTFTLLEEKRTDVQIALQMLDDAYENRADRFVLVSGDSDLVPAVTRVIAKGKEVIVYTPCGWEWPISEPEAQARGTGHADRRRSQPSLALRAQNPPRVPFSPASSIHPGPRRYARRGRRTARGSYSTFHLADGAVSHLSFPR